jgi:hypothetical protein
VLISLHENETEKIVNVSNETLKPFEGNICVAVKNNRFETLVSHRIPVSVGELSSYDVVLPHEISALLDGSPSDLFLEYVLEKDGVSLACDGKIYVKPSEYHFENPEISASIREENGAYYLDLTASRYAKNVMIEWENADVEPDDNFFDITNGKASVLLCGETEAIFSEMPKILSVYDVQKV